MRIAIVDDQEYFRNEIRNILNPSFSLEEIDSFESISQLLKSKNTYDLLLLDIEIPNENGMAFAKSHRIQFPFIIFVSSHNELIDTAFCSNIFGFVKKENLQNDLLNTIKEFEMLILHRVMYHFKTPEGERSLYEDTILCFQFNKESVYIHSYTEVLRIYETSLYKLEENLSDSFFRINRNIIINLNNIVDVRHRTRSVQLENLEFYDISEKRWKDFKQKYLLIRGLHNGSSS